MKKSLLCIHTYAHTHTAETIPRAVLKAGEEHVLWSEVMMPPQDNGGVGLVVVNPPEGFEDDMRDLVDYFKESLLMEFPEAAVGLAQRIEGDRQRARAEEVRASNEDLRFAHVENEVLSFFPEAAKAREATERAVSAQQSIQGFVPMFAQAVRPSVMAPVSAPSSSSSQPPSSSSLGRDTPVSHTAEAKADPAELERVQAQLKEVQMKDNVASRARKLNYAWNVPLKTSTELAARAQRLDDIRRARAAYSEIFAWQSPEDRAESRSVVRIHVCVSVVCVTTFHLYLFLSLLLTRSLFYYYLQDYAARSKQEESMDHEELDVVRNMVDPEDPRFEPHVTWLTPNSARLSTNADIFDRMSAAEVIESGAPLPFYYPYRITPLVLATEREASEKEDEKLAKAGSTIVDLAAVREQIERTEDGEEAWTRFRNQYLMGRHMAKSAQDATLRNPRPQDTTLDIHKKWADDRAADERDDDRVKAMLDHFRRSRKL
jgi:hypothetical protein